MKSLAIYAAAQFIVIASAIAQTTPTVAILYPNQVEVPAEILEELEVYKNQVEVTEEIRAKFVNPNLPEHWQKNRTKLLDFMEEQDFFSLATSSTSNQLSYLLNTAHDVLLCFPVKDISTAKLSNYRSICDQHGVAWVVNYTSMKLTMDDGKAKIEVSLQLYNNISNHIWIDKMYIGTEKSNGELPAWESALSDLVEQTTTDIYELLEKKRHYWTLQAN